MDERKGAFRAVRAFARLPQEIRRRACLLIAGNGQVRELRSEVQSNNLQDEVEVREWMNEDERNHALETSNAYVLPSLNEGLPMGLLEALSWGLPVIATPVGGIPEVIVDQANGLLVGPLDQPALTSAMSRLILDPALCQRLSRAARLTSERFDIGAYWRDLLPILRTSAGPVGDR
jgi:glycosyltransferase involved in cell wall biosynthesis